MDNSSSWSKAVALIRALRMAAAVVLVFLGVLMCLVAFGMAMEGDVRDVRYPGSS